MAERDIELADFLRLKRQLLRPEMIGLPDLQRTEADLVHRSAIAAAIGVTLAYYNRIESGVGRLPSKRVLRALIDVLELTDDEAAELERMVRAKLGTTRPVVDPQLAGLLDSWPMTAAFVCDSQLTVLASNPIARAVSPMFAGGTNVLQAMYLDPNAYEMIRNTAEVQAVTAAWAKKLAADHPHDASWTRLLDKISDLEPGFRKAWSRDVAPAGDGDFLLDHPAVGELDLYYRRFRIEGCDDQFLVTLHADPETPTQCGLRVLKEFSSRDDSPPQ
jgi:transcriptional regulator with XRE-family HTH domain